MSKHLLVRAARGEKVERPPIWAMRQAGRWDPEFNKLRAGLGFYEFSENVELSAKCSLLPRRFGVDAIILFYDITTLTVSMGLPFSLKPNVGPVPAAAIRTLEDVEKLDPNPKPATFAHITRLLHRVKEELRDELPVIVFAGAPFTVATYCIGTGKDLNGTRAFVAERTEVWNALLRRIQEATIVFLRELIRQGADVYQLFDSWAGNLNREEYLQWAQPQHEAILAGATGTPRVLFVKEGPYLDLLAKSGAEVISLGRCHDLAQARRDYPNLVFQGNVDQEILKKGTPEQVTAAVKVCLAEGGGQRHIVNLNHGVDKSTPPANFEAYIKAVRG
ncbi:MAG: uroporphyrinogen decarboxylase [Gemmataceae bacterium]|nr:uroporphyrinogen decarboxylase [Gemmataceae bacterium]